ncbi:ABC transporter ATP-binding protein [Paenarthrobacter aromaticivorans]|uniref:ABC transporter ATP-binding protein n=1 Tax=Paenarthrobacter aromaticivorans TaxID=2849150 RepID=A0ABS6I400_9MICC|nr:ABC transporter ATP-binding protein [Paenarthrobacter sp. MMS21-TAE1-1]MBU8865779.1 ABC transporter ATP-binding protein [Paenarthrobacter sp. MMS21-TAE1-1]
MEPDQKTRLPAQRPAAPEPASPRAVIECSGLTKAFGRKIALDAVNLSVPEGSIFGFLGPNGAGKTTLLRIMTGLSRATSGGLRILGMDVGAEAPQVRREVGYLPDVPAFYDWMTASQTLELAGRLCGLKGKLLADRVQELLGFMRLKGNNQAIGKYSRGMRQRLGVAQALINAPRLLLLDEPTSALDPGGRRELLEFIGGLRGQTTVFFSTHILSDVERVCDSVAILDKGKVLSQSSMDELRSRHGQQTIAVEVSTGAERLAQAIAGRKWTISVRPGPRGEILARVSDVAAAQHEIPALVSEQGTGLVRLESAEISLEDIFLELVGEPVP